MISFGLMYNVSSCLASFPKYAQYAGGVFMLPLPE